MAVRKKCDERRRVAWMRLRGRFDTHPWGFERYRLFASVDFRFAGKHPTKVTV
jgi:hypothetical protein